MEMGAIAWTKKKIPFTDLMRNKDESPRFLGIWLAGHVGRSLIKPGHAHLPFHSKMCCDNNSWTSQRDPQQKHLRNFSKYLQDQVWNAKKNARSLYVQQRCPTESSFKKTEMYDCARQDLYVESSEVHNFDINRCHMRCRKTEKTHRSQLGSPTSDFDWAHWQPAGAHLRSFGRCGEVAYICACRYVSVCLSRCAVIYVNVCVCVCPCAIYFRLLLFKRSENNMISWATLLKGWPWEWGRAGQCQFKLQSHASAKWVHSETGGCFGKSPNMFMPSRRWWAVILRSQRPQPTASGQLWAPVGQKLKFRPFTNVHVCMAVSHFLGSVRTCQDLDLDVYVCL